jgi:hypothetical protein
MNAEKLIAFIKAQGYTDAKVDSYKEGFRIQCRSPEYYIEVHYRFPISELPPKLDGSEKYCQIVKAFPFLSDKADL